VTRIIDLSVPLEEHFRWPFDRKLTADFANGDNFQITHLSWPVHGFTHIDAPKHIDPDGATTDSMALDRLIGAAAVLDLTDVAADSPIDADRLAAAGSHVEERDIVLLATGWDTRVSLHEPAFWTTAPYLTRDACDWLKAQSPSAVGFDFPQDYPIRGILSGETAPMSDFVSHDVLLRNGVFLIEYICNLTEIGVPRPVVVALPLKLPKADGAPARVVALAD
jgi:kynurenine formamidase